MISEQRTYVLPTETLLGWTAPEVKMDQYPYPKAGMPENKQPK